jgi:hypothetical protein
MIELYHFGFSTCSQKVRLVLAEKGLGFESHEVNLMAGGQHDPAYVKLNPKHVVPTLVHDGRVFVESSLIIGVPTTSLPRAAAASGGRSATRSRAGSSASTTNCIPAAVSPSRSDRGTCCSSSRRKCAKRTSRRFPIGWRAPRGAA